jgi:hypothetical protein
VKALEDGKRHRAHAFAEIRLNEYLRLFLVRLRAKRVAHVEGRVRPSELL